MGTGKLFPLKVDRDNCDAADRCAPEHPWPGPHEDMYDAVKWVGSHLIFHDQR